MNTLLYFVTAFVWGSTWLAITFQLGTIPIDLSIFYRFSLASLLIFAWCFFKHAKLRFSLEAHCLFMAQGLFLFSMNYMAAYGASYYIPSGLNAIGFSMVLVFNILNSALFYRIPLTFSVFGGAMSGMIGIIIIFWPSLSTLDLSEESLIGILLSLLAGLLSSFGNMVSMRTQKQGIPVMESNAYAMGYGAVWMFIVLYLKGIPLQFDFNYSYLISLFYLVIFGSIVAFGCYLTLLGRIGANKAGYVQVMTPVVALVISTFFEDLIWEAHLFIGVGLILLGNVITLEKKKSKPDIPLSLSTQEAV
ncbi:MAG: DMT family transporter [Alphaproteobacteria bacterium]|nr:DMT family transporter [Alphaproteobacteria bacterium]